MVLLHIFAHSPVLQKSSISVEFLTVSAQKTFFVEVPHSSSSQTTFCTDILSWSPSSMSSALSMASTGSPWYRHQDGRPWHTQCPTTPRPPSTRCWSRETASQGGHQSHPGEEEGEGRLFPTRRWERVKNESQIHLYEIHNNLKNYGYITTISPYTCT